MPNFFTKETVERWPSWVPKKQLPLGLDLRGGAHLLLSMEPSEVRKDWLEGLRDDARRRMRDAKIGVAGLGITQDGVRIRIAKPRRLRRRCASCATWRSRSAAPSSARRRPTSRSARAMQQVRS